MYAVAVIVLRVHFSDVDCAINERICFLVVVVLLRFDAADPDVRANVPLEQ